MTQTKMIHSLWSASRRIFLCSRRLKNSSIEDCARAEGAVDTIRLSYLPRICCVCVLVVLREMLFVLLNVVSAPKAA